MDGRDGGEKGVFRSEGVGGRRRWWWERCDEDDGSDEDDGDGWEKGCGDEVRGWLQLQVRRRGSREEKKRKEYKRERKEWITKLSIYFTPKLLFCLWCCFCFKNCVSTYHYYFDDFFVAIFMISNFIIKLVPVKFHYKVGLVHVGGGTDRHIIV